MVCRKLGMLLNLRRQTASVPNKAGNRKEKQTHPYIIHSVSPTSLVRLHETPQRMPAGGRGNNVTHRKLSARKRQSLKVSATLKSDGLLQ